MGSKIGKIEWILLYIVTGIIDFVQIIIDFFGGEPINVIADPIIGGVLLVYFEIRGVSLLTKFDRLASLLCATGLGAITGGFAPAWVADIWLIHRSVKREDAARKAAEEQDQLLQNTEYEPLYQNGVRQPRLQPTSNVQQPLNRNGIRSPGRIIRPPVVK